jgi:hypothetical protein
MNRTSPVSGKPRLSHSDPQILGPFRRLFLAAGSRHQIKLSRNKKRFGNSWPSINRTSIEFTN